MYAIRSYYGSTGEVWRLTVDDELGDRATVCHAGQETEVAVEAIHAHLVHGDRLGECP